MREDREIVIVRTGAANLASVVAAFERLDVRPVLSEDPQKIVDAQAVVLPGVGAFAPAIESLRTTGAAAAIAERFRRDAPLLCICLGMQLLFEESEEARGARGLALLPGCVQGLRNSRVVPHMGWNCVTAEAGAKHLLSGYAYFAHSYCVDLVIPGAAHAHSEQGQSFVAAFERGHLLACQFHPELSGSYGQALLQRWCASVWSEVRVAC